MLDYRLICFIALFSATYFVLIALLYVAIQFFHFSKVLNQLNYSLEHIDTLLQSSIVKLNIAKQSFIQTQTNIGKNLNRLKTIFTFNYPWIHSTNTNNKIKKLDKKMNKVLKKLNSLK